MWRSPPEKKKGTAQTPNFFVETLGRVDIIKGNNRILPLTADSEFLDAVKPFDRLAQGAEVNDAERQ
ncbi:hypothetical protein SODG_005405 [Sodalis praecaptivus]